MYPVNANNKFLRLNILFILLGCIVYAFYSATLNSGATYQTIDGDGSDYYSYLVSVFIKHDLGHQDLTPWFIINTPTGTINVHTIGISLLLLPFFAVACLLAVLFHFELNGFSFPFQLMVQVAAIFYGITGLYFLQKIAGFITNNIKIQIAVPVCILFGTNLLFYMVNSPSMSHIYSFALLSIFIYLSQLVFVQKKHNHLITLSVVFALIILVRPFNAVVLFLLPVWSRSFAEFWLQLRSLLSNKKVLMVSAILFAGLLSLQSVIWFIQNGKLLQDSYKGNGFYFTDPNTFKFLFGFTSGFFIYTPLCLLILIGGMIKLFSGNKFRLMVIAFFLSLVIYVLSSYWAYNFSDSLGMRVMVDYYAIFGILFIYALEAFRIKYFRYVLYSAVSCSVLFSLLFHYQASNGIISPAYMTYEKFKYVFLETGKEYKNVFGGCNDLEPFLKTKPSAPSFAFNKADTFEYTSQKEYGLAFSLDSVKLKTNKLYVEIEIERTEREKNSSSGALFACTVKDSAKNGKFWYAFKINETPSGEDKNTRKFNYSLVIDKKINYNDELGVFIWNIERQNFTVNKFNIKIYDYNFET